MDFKNQRITNMFGSIDSGDLNLEHLLLLSSAASAAISSFGTYILTGRKKLKIDAQTANVDMAAKLVDASDKIVEEMKQLREHEKSKRQRCEEEIKYLQSEVDVLKKQMERCIEFTTNGKH